MTGFFSSPNYFNFFVHTGQHCLLIYQDNILRQDANLDCASLHPEVKMGTWLRDRQFPVLCVAASMVVAGRSQPFCITIVWKGWIATPSKM